MREGEGRGLPKGDTVRGGEGVTQRRHSEGTGGGYPKETQ